MGDEDRPPFRADHVGSLLRPPELHAARAAFAEGRLDADGLRSAEDDAIRDVIRLQRDVGLRTVTDGEFRRASWHMDFIYRIGGIERTEGEIAIHFRSEEGELSFTPSGLHVAGKVHLQEPIFADHFEFLRREVEAAGREGRRAAGGDGPQAAGEGLVPKLTIPSPSMVHYRGGQAAIDPSVYADLDEFWDDLSAAYAAEVRALADRGCTYLQFDDTSLAYLNDPAQRAELAEKGGDAEHQHLRYIKQINAALDGRPPGLAVTTHMCRGNYRSSWAAQGSYDFVAEALFGELAVDGFFLEYDDARSGGFAPLRFVPPGKKVVLGLVTTKRPQLENKDELKRRIEEASRYVPIEQLCLSPQCGFASTVEGNRLTREEEIAKLRLVVETAAEVWG